jgi:eukaryotic-like serine/threonine-protein kinase
LELDFELLHRIGRGAYGEVWLARDKQRHLVAVKVIYQASFASDVPFNREFQGIRRFEPISRGYDYQLKILHVGQRPEEGCFYYVMEAADDLASGISASSVLFNYLAPQKYQPRTLKAEVQRKGRLPVSECIDIALALAGALENLHQHGLVHRDVKAANVIFIGGQPKLADIGLLAKNDARVANVGTEGYLPPEGPGSPRADIYSFGKLLYEISTGLDRLSFPSLPDDLAQWSDWKSFLELNVVIARACHPKSAKRYRSARAMYAALVQIKSGKSLRAKFRSRWWVKAAVFVGLGALALLAFFNFKR